MFDSRIVFVSHRQYIQGNPTKHLLRLIRGRPDALIIREKDLDTDALCKFVAPLVVPADEADVPIIINRDVACAKRLKIPRIHLSYADFMRIQPTHRDFSSIGVSIHNIDEVLRLRHTDIDYLLFGHVYATACKNNLPPRGLRHLRAICRLAKQPVLAIGGMTSQRLPEVMQCGAAGACFMHDAMTDASPHTIAARLRKGYS